MKTCSLLIIFYTVYIFTHTKTVFNQKLEIICVIAPISHSKLGSSQSGNSIVDSNLLYLRKQRKRPWRKEMC